LNYIPEAPYAFCEAFLSNFGDFFGAKNRQRACYRLKEEGLVMLWRVKTFKNPAYWQKSACPPQNRGEKVS
jgi:hypothetical protein